MADIIRMYSGDTKTFTLTVTNEAGGAVDCSAATEIKCTCYTAVGGDQLFQLTQTAGDIVVGGVDDNVLTITIAPTDTATASAAQNGTTYYMDVEVAFDADNIQTFPRDASGNPCLAELVLYGDLS